MGCSLIVHADDFGQSDEINDGVRRAFSDGILTSASVMANGKSFDSALEICRQNPDFDIGVHLTLVEERPLADPDSVPSLVSRSGSLHANHRSFLARYVTGKISLSDVERELALQIARAKDCGVKISHLDGHQHLHALPAIRNIVRQLARKFGIGIVRNPRESIRPYMIRPRHLSLVRLAELIALNSICDWRQKQESNQFAEFLGFYFGGRLDTGKLKTVLAQLPSRGVFELMCHPGSAASQFGDSATVDGYKRETELSALTDPSILETVREQEINLISFRDLSADSERCSRA